ncbi:MULTISPECIES: BolA family protein [Methylobacillus]|uniref:Transcriptional regulator, BolA protein family n=1 Tax=Methylobacillus flagellatus (strain ATCC 51484 / DSM 6875 / VKM B-1610 / KT) TaxID=265072 RepID=Q1H040_METFK|nr:MULTISPECIES: BolA family protein [Methylobacillus]ABE50147.1 transcriptional regulator, BolA protein family [Methylobacillus flagellatus KT]MPS48623.1 BolA family transcriptional regulator [Methylobacillus sp.]
MTLIEEIRNRLSALSPTMLEIRDDSALHKGHAGNNGGGHFFLTIASAEFSGKSQVMRHRQVYAMLGDLIPHKIHALSIQAIATDDPPVVTID